MPVTSLQSIADHISSRKMPPVDSWDPDFCGDIDITIDRDGSWYYKGSPIARERLVALFASVLRKDEDGETYLVTPVEKLKIQVSDAPFIAVSVEPVVRDGHTALCFTTNLGDKVIAGPDHPVRVVTDSETDEPRPYVLVRGRLEALISRPVFYELVEMGRLENDKGRQSLWIESNGARFCLGAFEGTS